MGDHVPMFDAAGLQPFEASASESHPAFVDRVSERFPNTIAIRAERVVEFLASAPQRARSVVASLDRLEADRSHAADVDIERVEPKPQAGIVQLAYPIVE